ncbi:MAG TPA: lysophospholipid acyltransferase family protein [Polyangia bacterium]|jgi:1-acyl-sn-glycerol-3-phosphate acyltransferase
MSQPTFRRLGRAAYVACGASVSAVVLIVLWLATVLARSPRRALTLQRAAARCLLGCLGCRFAVHRAQPPAGAAACVFVANHTSYLDIPLLLAALKRDFVFVTKRELLDWPFVSRITRGGGHIPVDRDSVESRGAAVARIVKTLRAGRSVLIFPEGTFSDDGGLRPFQLGAFKSALAAGVPIMPVAMDGVARLWSQHAPFPRPGRVEIWIGEALDLAPGKDEVAQLECLRAAALQFISAHLGGS